MPDSGKESSGRQTVSEVPRSRIRLMEPRTGAYPNNAIGKSISDACDCSMRAKFTDVIYLPTRMM